MGAWGTAIFSDDIACDVKIDYRTLLEEGMSGEEATNTLLESYNELLNDEEESLVFWLALAATQHSLGRLEEKVKINAINIINNGKDIDRWKDEPNLIKKRIVVLQKLREQLQSPQPEPKSIKVKNRKNIESKPIDINKIQYPFKPKSNRFLLPGQFFAIRLECGKFACGRVVGIENDNKMGFYAGLMNWIGDFPPTEVDLIDKMLVYNQCSAHIKTIHINALDGMILGHRGLKLDNLKPNIKEGTWGLNVIKILAEKLYSEPK